MGNCLNLFKLNKQNEEDKEYDIPDKKDYNEIIDIKNNKNILQDTNNELYKTFIIR